ncbi:MAG: diacylglycerol kinase family lipid kinase [Eubacterium sp.]|nr:diacylglycerol kinase family lipid kinase [Eubacterium sp.]
MLYFIVNLKSQTGNGLHNWRSIRNILDDNSIEYMSYETKYEGHAKKLASAISAIEDENKIIVAVGGDGTVNEVINGITGFENIRFAVIPSGSGNDFVRGHLLPSTRDEALSYIIERCALDEYRPADLGIVTYDNTQRIFAISSGLGLDAIVCKKALTSKLKKVLNNMHLGDLTYILLTVISLFTMDTSDFDMTITYENGADMNMSINKAIFAAAMNLFAEGGGVPMAPDAKGDDGLLTITCAHGIAKWNTFFKLPLLAKGKHTNIKGFDIIPVKKLTVHTSKPNVLHADGEYLGDVTDAAFEVLPGKLRLL